MTSFKRTMRCDFDRLEIEERTLCDEIEEELRKVEEIENISDKGNASGDPPVTSTAKANPTLASDTNNELIAHKASIGAIDRQVLMYYLE